MLNQSRNPLLVKARFGQIIIMSLLSIAIYWDLPDGYNADKTTDMRAIWNKNGFLFFINIATFMNSMTPIVLTFPSERVVFLKESNMKMYGVTSYFLGKTTPEFIFLVLFPFLFSVIIYWPTNMNTS